VLNDLDNAPISEKDRALYAFIKKMVHDSTSITQQDVDVARTGGWSDEALYDAITVCALFQFYNNWIDATGVADMPALGYELSGHRLATQGYASEGGEQPAKPKRAKSTRATKSKRARTTKAKGAKKSAKRGSR
jgi:hypothetical protein